MQVLRRPVSQDPNVRCLDGDFGSYDRSEPAAEFDPIAVKAVKVCYVSCVAPLNLRCYDAL